MKHNTAPGNSFPLGTRITKQGVNFCIFSDKATQVELLLFDSPSDAVPNDIIPLDPKINRTFHYWHVEVMELGHGQLYGYKVHGPHIPEQGLRYDGSKLLVDPYAKLIDTTNYRRPAAMRPGDNTPYAMKSVVVEPGYYDWEGDQPLRQPYENTVIYELHVGGFTRNPNSGVEEEKRGTYIGLTEKIGYLKQLGVTAIELLPVHQFDDQDVPAPLTNYWGYNTIGFFAPHNKYSSRRDLMGPIDEFRDMVKAFHKAGIEVILDVVFNHTAEGNHTGPMLSFRGLANDSYYILESFDKSLYTNYSGCGNTMNANQSIVRRMIMDSLRYWVAEMHIDGFRFDLASVMSRDESGRPLKNPPILWDIESDPVLAGTKIIAEAWDAAGLYQVGTFVGHRWAEWNGVYRDDIRRFVKGNTGMVPRLAARIMGSPDLYQEPNRDPNRSINFVTCHDGFTLNDLVSYNHKHNLANGEDNRDGTNDNDSWNCGHEGPTKDVIIDQLRKKQARNLMALLMLSQGTPMLLMGDEVLRTQNGNNNTYCQDNETGWFDWSLIDKNPEMLRFTRTLVQLIQSLEVFSLTKFLRTQGGATEPNIIFHGTKLGQPDWGADSHCLAFTLHHPQMTEQLHVMINMFWEELHFDLPPLLNQEGEIWHRLIDTSLTSPFDIMPLAEAPKIEEGRYLVESRSVVVLYAKLLG